MNENIDTRKLYYYWMELQVNTKWLYLKPQNYHCC